MKVAFTWSVGDEKVQVAAVSGDEEHEDAKLFLLMLATFARWADNDPKTGALYPSDECPGCGATYGVDHSGDCLAVAAYRRLSGEDSKSA